MAIPDDLDDLRGPITGVVHLPLNVYSSGAGPEHGFDLDDEAQRRVFYQIVLTDGRAADVCRYLDLAELHRLWPTMFLPPHVRRPWEPRLAALARQ